MEPVLFRRQWGSRWGFRGSGSPGRDLVKSESQELMAWVEEWASPCLVHGVLTGTFGMELLGSRSKLGQIWDFLRNFPLPACLYFPTVKGNDVSFVTSSLF